MTEPILSDDEVDAIYERVHAEWEARNKCAPNLWVAFTAAVLEKVCREPRAWVVEGGRTFVDKAFIREASADASIAERNDGARKTPLYTLHRSRP
ncbi:hypothetical protein [Burkholderia sp. BCC0405]|uniref:hypothetical protein n=1 Tax=Burkholderia sp. BCC0405 TaxID=2676298 RepID=UPI00158D71EA|nr:hypothetical protein [Burkholderia sp. BCC0405]